MVLRTKIVALFLVLCLFTALALPVQALAWNENTQGNNESDENNKDVNGVNSASTELKGWLGRFDNTYLDEERPAPPVDEDWINVSIPTVTLFGSIYSGAADARNEELFSPVFHIYNHSARNLAITATSFLPTNDVDVDPDTLPTEEQSRYRNDDDAIYDYPMKDSTITLRYVFQKMTGEEEEPTWLDGQDVVLRTDNNDFLGDDVGSSADVIVARNISSSEPFDQPYIIYGYLWGYALPTSYPYPPVGSPHRPYYNLVFTFEPTDEEATWVLR